MHMKKDEDEGKHVISVKKLETILIEATFLSSLDEMDDLLCRIWHLLSGASKEELDLVCNIEFHTNLLQKIFSGHEFSSRLISILEIRETYTQNNQSISLLKQDPDYLEGAIFVKAGLELAFLPLFFVANKVIAKEYRAVLKGLLQKVSRNNFSASRVALTCSEILKEKEFNHKIQFTTYTSKMEFFQTLVKVSMLGQFLLVLGMQIELASECFARSKSIVEAEEANINSLLRHIHDVTHIFSIHTKNAVNFAAEESHTKQFINDFVFSNEIILIQTLRSISYGFHEGNFVENLNQKMASAESDLEQLKNLAKQHMQVFTQKKEDEYEWANKIVLITVKTLSVFSMIHDATDQKWKVSVGVRELFCWIDEVNEVVNMYLTSDDWQHLLPYLHPKTEGTEIEWKSTFYTPLENSKFSKINSLADAISDTILAMLNSSGGVIVIGLVEKPKQVNKSSKKFLHNRSGYTFFDISEELKKYNITLDDIQRDLQQRLANIASSSIGQFDKFWNIQPIHIACHKKPLLLVLIHIKKMDEPFVSKVEKNHIFIRKRIKGSNIDVDPRTEFILTKK